MTQPDLGKKISELRLSKGLTQAELAEKCNLSLRTIQRIESAEVMPRSYTIKLIFESLDYEIYNSFGKLSYKLDRIAYRLKIWLEQFYKYVLDLFNLKTETMKKVTVLFISLVVIVFLVSTGFGISFDSRSKKLEEFQKISSNQLYMDLFNSGKLDSLAMMCHKNICVMTDDGLTLIGRQNINAHDRELYNRGIRFTELTTQDSFVEGSIAVERGTWTVVLVPKNISVKGSYLTQWRYSNKVWRIENSMSKTDEILSKDN